MRARYLDVRRATVAAAVVDGKARRLNARRILRTVSRCRRAVFLVCDDARRVYDRRAAARSYLASVAGTCANRTLDSFFFQADDGIRAPLVTGVQTCALPI